MCAKLYIVKVHIPRYKKFIKGYEEWREMSKQEKHDHLKSFFNFIPSQADLNTCGINL